MIRLILNSVTEAEFASVQQTAEICSQTGRVLGYFIPVLDTLKYPRMEPQISDEELQRRMKQGGGRPLSAILADLEKRA